MPKPARGLPAREIATRATRSAAALPAMPDRHMPAATAAVNAATHVPATACHIVIGRIAACAASARARIVARHQMMAAVGGSADQPAAIVLHRRGDGDEVAADRAAGDVRLQLRCGVRRPAAERDRLEHVGFATALDHRSVSRRSAASRRRARNSSILMLDVFNPSAAEISSCDEPCA